MLSLSSLLFMFRLSLNREVKHQVSQVFISNKVARDKLNYLNLSTWLSIWILVLCPPRNNQL